VKTTVKDSEIEYAVDVSFLPVSVFDEAKNQRLNRMKAEQYCQKALSRYLGIGQGVDVSEGSWQIEFSYSGADIHTLKSEDDFYAARIVIPKKSFNIIHLAEQDGPVSKSEPTLKNEPALTNKPASKNINMIDRDDKTIGNRQLKMEEKEKDFWKRGPGEGSFKSIESASQDRLDRFNISLRDQAATRLEKFESKTDSPDVDLEAYKKEIQDDIDNEISSFLEELENEKLIMKKVLGDYQNQLRDNRKLINDLIEKRAEEIRIDTQGKVDDENK
jgi:hypothetical protein